ncbi:hypothetical protein ACIPLC_37935 [Kitasatospora sp. NPDC086801]|uniref:hypothetical protein n=1 Tax=Kitasatospora sp. NPDC086801 TaxID=3364066 RepID=UPI00380A7CE3
MPTDRQLVFDRHSQRTGVYMDTLAGKYYMRPETGGCEWTADPADVEPAPPPLEYANPAGAPRGSLSSADR